eukprot:1954239-Pleurochrysis_carterae.AAC.1
MLQCCGHGRSGSGGGLWVWPVIQYVCERTSIKLLAAVKKINDSGVARSRYAQSVIRRRAQLTLLRWRARQRSEALKVGNSTRAITAATLKTIVCAGTKIALKAR